MQYNKTQTTVSSRLASILSQAIPPTLEGGQVWEPDCKALSLYFSLKIGEQKVGNTRLVVVVVGRIAHDRRGL